MEWVRSFLQTAVLLGASSALTPASPKIRKATLFVFAVLFLSALAMGAEREGLWDFLRFEVGKQEEPPVGESWSETYQEGVEEGILLDLCEKFDLDERDVRVYASLLWEEDAVSLSSLTLFLSGVSATRDIPSLVRYAEKTYQTECEVNILGG